MRENKGRCETMAICSTLLMTAREKRWVDGKQGEIKDKKKPYLNSINFSSNRQQNRIALQQNVRSGSKELCQRNGSNIEETIDKIYNLIF